MSHFGDYMDDVPVKISEKYKPPPRIELPYNVNDSVSRANALIENVHYDFNFETNILTKLNELRRAKETIKNERLHRLQLIKEAKQAELDRIAAAETEAKLKQLNVSEVSYPSTEEISEISLDESTDRCSNNKDQLSSSNNCEVDEQKLQHVTSHTSYYDVYDSRTHANGMEHGYSTRKDTFLQTESRPEILKPIPLLSNTCQPNLLDDPDPLREIQHNLSLFNTSQLRMFYKKNNIEKLTFSDFENDTSSPFDNMELKTINDFELLAQALESQKEQTAENVSQVEYGINNQQDLGYLPSTSFYPSNSIHSVSYNYNEHPIVNHVASTYSSPQAYVSSDGYYHTPIETVNNCDNVPPASVTNVYMPAYSNYYATSNACQNSHNIDTNFYSIPQNDLSYAIPPKNISINENFNTTQHSEPYQYYDYRQQNSNYNAYNNITQPVGLENAISRHQISQSVKENYSTVTISSRSRSVPDIMKELDEEISSTRLKYNQRSSNSSPVPHDQPSRKQSASGICEIKTASKIIEKLPNPYETLSPELQRMCKNISSMGFPLSRVARVSLLTGENDKKIIECLLAIGQLKDLGFSEKQVVTALIKNDFNRDKALDDLVS